MIEPVKSVTSAAPGEKTSDNRADARRAATRQVAPEPETVVHLSKYVQGSHGAAAVDDRRSGSPVLDNRSAAEAARLLGRELRRRGTLAARAQANVAAERAWGLSQ